MAFGKYLRRKWDFSFALEGGWLALASVIMAGYLAYGLSADILSTFKQAATLFGQSILIGEAMDEDVYTLAIVTAISFLLLWTVTSSLQNLVESAAAAWSRYRNFRGNRRLEGSISLGVRPSMDSHKVPRTSRIALGLRSLSWFNRALVVSSIAAPLALLGTNTLLEIREDRLRDRVRNGSHTGRAIEEPITGDNDQSRFKYELRRSEDTEKAEFIETMMQVTGRALEDFPDVASSRSYLGRSIETGWRLDDENPDLRWRVTVNVNAPLGWRDLSSEEAALRSTNVYARVQYRGRFGLWLEDPIGGDSFQEEQRRASAVEDEIVEAAKSALGSM
jgi:hypothetical protein